MSTNSTYPVISSGNLDISNVNITKPKKNKHKRRKVKLAYLQFYKVDGDGKVTRLRKDCPNAECGAGVFMANHFDRHYCGKCGLTYVYSKEETEKAAGGKGKGKGGK
jgi:ribosomal protein S27AE